MAPILTFASKSIQRSRRINLRSCSPNAETQADAFTLPTEPCSANHSRLMTYQTFASAWRFYQFASLFDYAPGQSRQLYRTRLSKIPSVLLICRRIMAWRRKRSRRRASPTRAPLRRRIGLHRGGGHPTSSPTIKAFRGAHHKRISARPGPGRPSRVIAPVSEGTEAQTGPTPVPSTSTHGREATATTVDYASRTEKAETSTPPRSAGAYPGSIRSPPSTGELFRSTCTQARSALCPSENAH